MLRVALDYDNRRAMCVRVRVRGVCVCVRASCALVRCRGAGPGARGQGENEGDALPNVLTRRTQDGSHRLNEVRTGEPRGITMQTAVY